MLERPHEDMVRMAFRSHGQLYVQDLPASSPEAQRYLSYIRDQERADRGVSPVKYKRRPGNSIVNPGEPVFSPGAFGRFTYHVGDPKKVLGNYTTDMSDPEVRAFDPCAACSHTRVCCF